MGFAPPGLLYAERAPQRRPAASELSGHAQLPGYEATDSRTMAARTSRSVISPAHAPAASISPLIDAMDLCSLKVQLPAEFRRFWIEVSPDGARSQPYVLTTVTQCTHFAKIGLLSCPGRPPPG